MTLKKTCCTAALFGLGLAATARGDDRPNFVLVVVDDASRALMYGARLAKTVPDIELLASQGVEFNRALATNTVCAPSRASLMSGQYSHNHRVHCNSSPCSGGETGSSSAFDTSRSLPAWMRAAGYSTAHFGKWLNQPPEGMTPPPEWDEWQGLVDPSTYMSYGWALNVNGTLVRGGPQEHQTRALAARTVAWVEAHRDGPSPLFVSLAPVAPHFTFDYRLAPAVGAHSDVFSAVCFPDLLDRYLHPDRWAAALAAPLYAAGKPSFGVPYATPDLARPAMTQVDMGRAWSSNTFSQLSLIAVNDMVRDVRAAFGARPLVVVFVSDNGKQDGEHDSAYKMSPQDESAFVPLYVWSQGVAGFRGGRVAEDLVLNQDVPLTIADLAGATPTVVADGRSLVPILLGGQPLGRKRALIEHWKLSWPAPYPLDYEAYWAVRTAPTDALPRRLFVEFPGTGDRALWDSNSDPYQVADVSAARPAEVAALRASMLELRDCAGQACRDAEDHP